MPAKITSQSVIGERIYHKMKSYYNNSNAYLNHLQQEETSKNYNWYGYVNFASRFMKEGDKVLELGCGIGTGAVVLKSRKNINLTATDLSVKFINFARRKYAHTGISFEIQDSTQLKYRDATFDVVTSMGMLEHLPSPMRSVDEMLRVLKPHGKLIIVFPNWFSWFKIIKALLNIKKKEYFTNNRREMVLWLLKSFFYFGQKHLNPEPIFRTPNLTSLNAEGPGYHSDEDMVYLAHPLDVKHYLKQKNCLITRISADTFRFSFIPTLAPYGGVVAIKKG
jgi:2-polyprenyl-3-methyl-5-hydroxy-6-metoxy-1,4-benzoquinol methylase